MEGNLVLGFLLRIRLGSNSKPPADHLWYYSFVVALVIDVPKEFTSHIPPVPRPAPRTSRKLSTGRPILTYEFLPWWSKALLAQRDTKAALSTSG